MTLTSPTPYRQIASGASFGALAHDEHASLAVQAAAKKIPNHRIGGVLLFLSTGYALHPQNAIKEAAKASGTLNITGCCALGIFTDQDSSTKMEGAVALVFSHETALRPLVPDHAGSEQLCLSLSSPNAGGLAIQSANIRQFGALASDEYGEGPYSLWQGGRIVEREYSHNLFSTGSEYYLAKSESVRPISKLMQINRSDRHQLIEVGEQLALDSLYKNLPNEFKDNNAHMAVNIVAVVSETSDPKSIESGHHQLLHVVSVDTASSRLMLSEPIKAGRRMYWAIRDPKYAEQQMRRCLLEAKQNFPYQTSYALMFTNINRSTEFYQGHDRDLQLFREIFPDTPMAGILSHAEIVPGYRSNAAIHHSSSVFAIFA